MEKTALFWSGGKDSAYALFQLQNFKEYSVELLVTTLSKNHRRVAMHGIREELLDGQAAMLDLPLFKMWVPDNPANAVYEEVFLQTLISLKKQGFSAVIFGDIFLEDLRQYREKLLERVGLKPLFPLWKADTSEVLRDFVNFGFKAVICCINSQSLEKRYLGKELNRTFQQELPESVDPCGENGEYHSFCYDGPIFKAPVKFSTGEEKFSPLMVARSDGQAEHGFWFLDLLP